MTPQTEKKQDLTTNFKYTDSSGNYLYTRESKQVDNKLITRVVIMDSKKNPLESSVLVSKLGSVKGESAPALLPEASQFYVWFNKKQFKSQFKLLPNKKEVAGLIEKPGEAQKSVQVKLKAGRYYCFFSQLPECIERQNILMEARTKKILIFIIWDNYPFNSEQYESLPSELVTLANFSFFEKQKDNLAFELDIGNQVILFHFDRQLKFEKMFWIAQGISIVKEGR